MKHASFRRIFELDRMIRLGNFKSAQQAANHFGVSRRTIERDIDELRYQLRAPLEYNRAKRHYEYKDKPVTLPAQWLTENEIAILLIAERALRVFTGTNFDQEIHPAFNKFLDPIRHDKRLMNYVKDLCNCVHFSNQAVPSEKTSSIFSTVLDASMQKKRLSIIFNNGTAIEFDPYTLINNRGKWFLVGYNKKSKNEETLFIEVIKQVEIQDQFFAIPKSFNVNKYLKRDLGRIIRETPVSANTTRS
jgi:predicted DNA-binding transcriptional regulator YafY